MKLTLIGRIEALMLLAFTVCLGTGCAAFKGMEAIGTMGDRIGEMIVDQGVLDQFATRMEGNFFNPGMETYVCISTGLRLVGAHGEIDASAHGTGTQLPTGIRKALIEQLNAARSPDEREALLTILGWNRIESPHNPTSSGQ